MAEEVFTKLYSGIPFDMDEALRYASAGRDKAEKELMEETYEGVKDKLTYKVCYMETIPERLSSLFGDEVRGSDTLAKYISGAGKVIFFAATVGFGLDRMISSYGSTSPVKALLIQGIGAAQIEALCDRFSGEMAAEYPGAKPRISPGYGDIPLSLQKRIISVLDTERKIGVTLNDAMLMTPSKSVTAIMALCADSEGNKAGCESCNMKDCGFRKNADN